MQALPRNVLRFRLQRLGLLLIAFLLGSGPKIAVSYQKPPIIEETIPESLRGDPKIEGLVSQLTLARRSLSGIGAAHPSYGKTKKLVEQLETSLVMEINRLMSNPEGGAGGAKPALAESAPAKSAAAESAASKAASPVSNPNLPVARQAIPAKEGVDVDITKPVKIDLPDVTAVFDRLPRRRLIRLGAFPGTRILWGLEEGAGSVSSRLWKWGDFDRATVQQVLLESEEQIFDIQFADDFLQSGVCYLLVLGQGSESGNVRLLQWQILDAGDPSPNGRKETPIGMFRTDHPAGGRFAASHAQALVVLWDQATEFVQEDQRAILASPDRRSFLIDSHPGQGIEDAFSSVSETSRRAWETWNASGPEAVTKEGLLFHSLDAQSHVDSIVDTVPPAYRTPADGQSLRGPFITYRGSRMPWLSGSVVCLSADRLTVHRIRFSGDGQLQSAPIARSSHAILTLGESGSREILMSTEQGLATLDLPVLPEAARMDPSQDGNRKPEVSLADEGDLKGLDAMARLQLDALEKGKAAWGHWGSNPDRYIGWSDHSNRLIPVYCFGGSLEDYRGENSIYRSEAKLAELYGQVPKGTANPTADYFDQTDLYDLQRRALQNGKKYLFLMVFDGMDWQTTWAAAIYASREIRYLEGRGSGLSFQDYRGSPTDFGFVVTSPRVAGGEPDPDAQRLARMGEQLGGYHGKLGGKFPWSPAGDPDYLLGRNKETSHAYSDSSSAATSINSGIKTFTGSVNIGMDSTQRNTIAHIAQREYGMAVGAVTSVEISDATIAAAYAHNVSRDDYQDISRDLLGMRSVSHRDEPLPGLDVLIGTGFGVNAQRDRAQGSNFQPGNQYIADLDLEQISVDAGGTYRVVTRTGGRSGAEVLNEAVDRSLAEQSRLLGFFGTAYGHLPFQTANGDWVPVGASPKKTEVYKHADIAENPTIEQMTSVAIRRLEGNPNGFWLLVEAGDIDRANHANNLDDSIGSVLSGARAFDEIVRWIEQRDGWDESLVIVTADHGHAFNLTQPQVIADAAASEASTSSTGFPVRK
jgi:alkaline phosphatase